MNEQVTITALTLATLAFTRKSPMLRTWWRYPARDGLSAAVLVLYLVAIVYFTVATGGMDSELGTTRYLRFAIVMLIFVISSLGATGLKRKDCRSGRALRWFGLYPVMCLLTAAYSLDSFVTAWKSIEIGAGFMVGLCLAKRTATLVQAQALLDFVWLLLLALVISAFWGWLLYPELATREIASYVGDEDSAAVGLFTSGVHGVFPIINANTLTQVACTVAVMALSGLMVKARASDRFMVFVVFGFAFLVALLAHSRTSLISMALCLLLYGLYTGTAIGKKILMASVMAIIAGLPLVTVYLARGQTSDQLATMTGRTTIWVMFWDKYLESPLLGYGFYSAARELFHVPGADNAYLTVLLGGGVLLFILFLIPLSIVLYRSYFLRPGSFKQSVGESYRVFWFQLTSVLIFIFVRSFTGPSFDAHHINLMLYIVVLVGFDILKNSSPDLLTTPKVVTKQRKYAHLLGS